MSASALIILSSSWDIDFFITLTGVTNHYGYEVLTDGIHFKYDGTDYDAVESAYTSYPVQYLSVMRPQVLENLMNYRKNLIENFQYHGSPLPLDSESRLNLTGATLGLMRNPDVLEIHWKVSEGVYTTISQATMLDMADQAFRFIESCFSHENDLAAQINAAADINVLATINITQGWPPYPGQTV